MSQQQQPVLNNESSRQHPWFHQGREAGRVQNYRRCHAHGSLEYRNMVAQDDLSAEQGLLSNLVCYDHMPVSVSFCINMYIFLSVLIVRVVCLVLWKTLGWNSCIAPVAGLPCFKHNVFILFYQVFFFQPCYVSLP
uniref:Uncharacterized protein n=1 Tax=Cacopsylla melanoneura TaxID=428564 RepID=A0A8D8ZDP9_9HEMI